MNQSNSNNPMVGATNWEGQRRTQSGGTHEPYHFTSEEMRVLKECNRESFYQRSLPLGTLFGVGTYYAVKSGYLGAGARFGATPKVFLAAVAGYFLGKLSYQKTCAEKMMALPNSPLGEMLRRRRQQSGGLGPSLSDAMSLETSLNMSPSPPTSGESFAQYSEHGPRSMDLDITRPPADSNIGDIRPQFSDDVYMEEEPLPAAQQSTTYEELRRQNREEYDRRRIAPRPFPGIEDPPPRPRAPNLGPQTSIPEQNQYGDTGFQ